MEYRKIYVGECCASLFACLLLTVSTRRLFPFHTRCFALQATCRQPSASATWRCAALAMTTPTALRGAFVALRLVCASQELPVSACRSQDEFLRFGTIRSVWVARKPPGFGAFNGPNSALCQMRGCSSAPARCHPCVTFPVSS